MDGPSEPERFFGVTTIKDRCDCGRPAVAVMPIRELGKDPEFLWLCRDHTRPGKDMLDQLDLEGARSGPQEITRTCGQDVRGTPCGAVATHVAMVGMHREDGRAWLGVASVCARHAETYGQPINDEGEDDGEG